MLHPGDLPRVVKRLHLVVQEPASLPLGQTRLSRKAQIVVLFFRVIFLLLCPLTGLNMWIMKPLLPMPPRYCLLLLLQGGLGEAVKRVAHTEKLVQGQLPLCLRSIP